MKDFKEHSESLKKYFEEVKSFPVYDQDELTALFKKYTDGDNLAKEKITLSNLRLVISVAKKFTNDSTLFMDLIQEGTMGLVRAIELFDVDKGNRFSTYATFWIRQKILKHLSLNKHLVRVPENISLNILSFNKKKKDLEDQLCRKLTTKELKGINGYSKKTSINHYLYQNPAISLDQNYSAEDGDTLYNTIPSDSELSLEDEILNKAQASALSAQLKELSPKERLIIELRYGLNDGYQRSQRSISKLFNVSSERIRQIEVVALKKLKGLLSGYFSTQDSAFRLNPI